MYSREYTHTCGRFRRCHLTQSSKHPNFFLFPSSLFHCPCLLYSFIPSYPLLQFTLLLLWKSFITKILLLSYYKLLQNHTINLPFVVLFVTAAGHLCVPIWRCKQPWRERYWTISQWNKQSPLILTDHYQQDVVGIIVFFVRALFRFFFLKLRLLIKSFNAWYKKEMWWYEVVSPRCLSSSYE